MLPKVPVIHIHAAVPPGDVVVTEVDTGGSATEVLASYLGVQVAPGGNSGVGVSGAEVASADVGARVWSVAGVDIPVAHVMARTTMSQPDMVGLLGMDVLRGTVVAVARDTRKPVVLALPQAPTR